jgi:hypothetical protein
MMGMGFDLDFISFILGFIFGMFFLIGVGLIETFCWGI